MAQVDGSIRIGTEITTKQAEKELKSLEGSIAKTAEKIASLRSKMDTLKDTKIPTQEYSEISTQIQKAESEFNKLLEKQEQMQREGKDNGVAWERLNEKMEEIGNTIRYVQGELQDLVDTGKAFTLGSNTEKYAEMSAQMEQLNQQMEADTQRQSELQNALASEEERLAQIKANATVSDQNIIDLLERRRQLISEIKDMEAAGVGLGYQQYEDANRELEEINGKIKDYQKNLGGVPEKFENMRKSAQKAFGAISKGTKKSSGLFSTFISRLKGIALSLLIFNWISKGFNAMISGMKKGFENLAGYSDSYAQSVQSMKNAMSTLGNQFAAAFAPIVQMVIPWLNSLIGVITTAMAYVAQFIAILGGKSTFTKAKKVQDDYNKSLGGTAKAADKARGALAKFDDLDVLEKKQEDAGGSGSAGTTNPSDMFEEVEISPEMQKVGKWLDDIKKKIKPILDYLGELKDIFMEGFWDGLGDWEYRWESIKNSIKSIKDSLVDIFTDSEVVAAADQYVKSVAYMFGSLVGSLASIGLTIATNLVGGIAKYLEQNKDRIKEYLISMFDIWAEINMMFAILFQSIAYVFEAFASEQGQQLTANIIGIFVDAFMGITELASKLFRDIANIIIQPFVDNKEGFREALEGLLDVLASVTGTIKDGIDATFDKLNEVYDEHFKPFFDSVAQGISEIINKILDFWNETLQPILMDWAAEFDKLFKSHIQPLINNFIELLGDIADMLKVLWENILQPFIVWIIDNILPVIDPIMEDLKVIVFGVLAAISDTIHSIISVIRNIIQFLTDVFKGDWEAAWNDVVNIVKSIIPLMQGVGINLIEGIKSGISSAWEGLKETVSNIADSITKTIKDILGIHSPSTVFAEIGGYIIQGLSDGISSAIDLVLTAISAVVDGILGLFSFDKWTEAGQGMINSIVSVIEEFKEIWYTSFNEWVEINQELYFGYDIWYEQFSNILTAYNDVNSEFMSEWQNNMNIWWTTMVMPYFTVLQWKTFGENMKNGIMQGFKAIANNIAGVLNQIIQLFNAAYKELQDAMNELIDDYNSKASQLGTSKLSHVKYNPMDGVKVPQLATGAVIRGGNPFMAILGDQPAGQTNIEAPLSTIEQAVENVISRQGYNRESVPVNINLNYDGETFARLSISDILSELGRQGFNVDVLGVT